MVILMLISVHYGTYSFLLRQFDDSIALVTQVVENILQASWLLHWSMTSKDEPHEGRCIAHDRAPPFPLP